MKSIREELTDLMIRKHAQLSDDALREALGKWVSGVEPEIVRSWDGKTILGIGALGHGDPIIPVRGVDVYLTYGGKRI